MAIYGEDYNSIRRRNQSYFPSVNFAQAPGVAEGQARMDQLAATGTYKSRRDDFRNKYPQFVNPSAQQALQNFDVKQAYAQGYGAPNPTIQQGPGGPYRVAGGVANPYNPPNAFQRFGSDVATAGRGISAIYSGAGTFVNALRNVFGAGKALYGQRNQGQIPVPSGINNLVSPSPLVGPSPNEQMFATGAGGTLPFPSQQPMLGTVRMANERFPGNLAVSDNSQYPTPIYQPPNKYANPGANATPSATPNTGPDSQYFSYNPSPLQPRRFDFNYF